MIDIEKMKDRCYGCMACKNVCPAGCIKTITDNEGFYYPTIDKAQCLDCGLCEKVCIAEGSLKSLDAKGSFQSLHNESNKEAYWVKHKETEKILKSSSGGAFTAFAEKMTDENGVVFGAVFDAFSKTIKHESTLNVILEKLKKSKYCESNIDMTYQEIKKILDLNRKVMFVGTPCQCAGLISFLGKEDGNLFLVDFVCHGVPSTSCMQAYIAYQEKKNKSKVINIDMRAKDHGWDKMRVKVVFKNGKEFLFNGTTDIYMSNFFQNTFLRKSCYHCEFTKNHKSDITLADFWGYKAYDANLNKDNTGISLVVCNTEKGIDFFNSIKEKVDFGMVPYDKFEYIYQRNQSEYNRNERENFIKKVKKAGLFRAMRSYRNKHVIRILKSRILGK